MKDLNRIEALLEKYFRGETSTQEESMLRRFFAESEVPEHLEAEAGLFRYFDKARTSQLPAEMEERLDRIASDAVEEKPTIRIRWRYSWVSAAAAVILVLIGIFLDLKIRKSTPYEVRKDTYEDPYLAYAEAKKVLYLVSEKMNTGTEALRNLDKLDEGMNYMHPVFSFGAGVQYLENFSKIEETKKLIAK